MTLQSTNQLSVLTVRFDFGTQVLRFCDAAEDFVADGNTYTSDVNLRFEAPERSGLLEEDDGELFMSSVWTFLQQSVDGRAFPPLTIEVVEYVMSSQIPATPAADVLYHYRGKVAVSEINPDGEEGVCKLTSTNPKQRTEKSLDSLALERCRNDFGSMKVCQFDRDAVIQTGTMTVIDRNTVTITGIPSQINGWFQDGYVEYQGLRIKIRDWRSGDTFVLTQIPPISWEESLPITVDVAPGCDKSRGNCNVFNQNSVFRGIGIDIPDHHPVFEKPKFV